MSTGERIRVIRQAVGFSQADLAESLDIDTQALEAYETGQAEAPPEVVWGISQYIGVDLAFFLRTSPLLNINLAQTDRREATPNANWDMAIAETRIWMERYLDLESYFELDDLKLYSPPPGFPRFTDDRLKAVQAATDLRAAWELGDAPIKNMAALLEDHGIKLCLVHETCAIDAAAFRTADELTTPLMAVSVGLSAEEERFALARELAYLMCGGITPQMAPHFAAAFLIPSQSLRRDLGKERTELEDVELHILLQKYGVKPRPLLTRAANLGLITAEAFHKWVGAYPADPINNTVPGDDPRYEVPLQMVSLAMRLLAQGELDEDRVAEFMFLPWVDWEKLWGFPQTELLI